MSRWILMILCSWAWSQDAEQIQRERERAMHLRPVVAGEPTKERGTGFYVNQTGLNFINDLRWSFACSDSSITGEIPAKFKNVTWRIKGKAPTTNIEKGIVQTDQSGVAMIIVKSNLKDLSGVTFELNIENQALTMVAGEGPYSFTNLPLAACRLPKSK